MWELLAPAGSYESIIAAVNAGADAVYVGGRLFGARAYADNPEEEQLIHGLEYCHLHGRKLYLTVNTLLKERELETMLDPYLRPFYENGMDGVIVQDFGVMRFVQEVFPGLPVHASTQMTVTGPEGARLLRDQGITRVVAARELSLMELRAIIEEAGVEVETFIHGAMCYSYSGKCLFSSLLGGRSGNRGRCAQPCRLPYRVCDARDLSGEDAVRRLREKQKASEARNVRTEAAFLLSMKDMCALDLLPELLDAGIASLKIEGRMKRPEYTAGVVSVYRKYIDLYREFGRENYRVEDEDRNILLDLYNRGGFSEGYYRTHNGRKMMSMNRPNHQGMEAIRVSVEKAGRPKYTALAALGKGDVIELAPGREITLGESVKKAGALHVPLVKEWQPKDGVLWRTKNAGLLERIRTEYLDKEIQEKVCGSLHVPADGPAVLSLLCRGVHASCSLEIAEPARNQPTDADTVHRQMTKTGGTPFVFERLDIDLADGLFIPVAKLNELRREGLSLLREEILAKQRRTKDAGQGIDASRETVGDIERLYTGGQQAQADGFQTNVLVTTEAQLEALFEFKDIEINTVYLDSLIFGGMTDPEQRAGQLVQRVKDRGWRCFLSCPEVLRERERAFLTGDLMQTVMREMDGFLLHTVDELAFFRNYVRENGLSAILASDDDLYAYNSRAAGFLRRHGVERFTLPAELNFRELLALDTSPAELNVYGYQALMQSAQCVVKNTDRCTKIPKTTYLKDRKNACFPVLNRCPFCCNTIYNSLPLMLCGCRAELARLAPEYVRLSFTVESKAETAHVLRACADILTGEESAEASMFERTTRGHFRRGVE